MLCLLNRLVLEVARDPALQRMDWLAQLLLRIDPRDPSISAHAPHVLRTCLLHLQSLAQNVLPHPLATTVQLLIHTTQSLLSLAVSSIPSLLPSTLPLSPFSGSSTFSFPSAPTASHPLMSSLSPSVGAAAFGLTSGLSSQQQQMAPFSYVGGHPLTMPVALQGHHHTGSSAAPLLGLAVPSPTPPGSSSPSSISSSPSAAAAGTAAGTAVTTINFPAPAPESFPPQ